MDRALKDGYRGLIRLSKPKNEVMRASMQGACGGRKPLVDKKQMYRMRYEMTFMGMSMRQISRKYGLDEQYVRLKVFDYATMSLVIPVKSIHPDDYEG